MNIETIRSDLAFKLGQHFPIASVKSTIIPASKLRGPALRSSFIAGFEFITSKGERYHTYAIETANGVLFTRPKEGISEYLVSDIRDKDFYFRLTGDVHSRQDLVGRFIENHINVIGYKTIKEFISHYAEKGNIKLYATGYKITKQHKHTLTFDGVVEILVDKGEGFKTFKAEFISGMFLGVKDPEGKVITMEEVFDVK